MSVPPDTLELIYDAALNPALWQDVVQDIVEKTGGDQGALILQNQYTGRGDAVLANVDPAMQQAAANLGASRWTILRRITLPLIRPGVFAGATLVMIWSFTELGTPLMFDFYTITPVQVFASSRRCTNTRAILSFGTRVIHTIVTAIARSLRTPLRLV